MELYSKYLMIRIQEISVLEQKRTDNAALSSSPVHPLNGTAVTRRMQLPD